MAGKKKGSVSRFFVWIILLMLIVGLGGFGITNFGGTQLSVASVGDEEITVDEYYRGLRQDLAAFEAQTGQSLPLQQALLFGLDQAVLQRLISAAALDGETRRINLSVGDERLREQIFTIPSFQGPDGSFNRDSYRFALSQAGLDEEAYEELLRDETSRTILQGAIVNGAQSPAMLGNLLVGHQAERRSFTWVRLDHTSLASPLPDPTSEELQTYYEAHPSDFTEPEKKRITYAWLLPEMLLDTVEIDEDALREVYEDRIEEFVRPERRLVERLVFGTDEEAADAAARLAAGDISFNALVSERGLALADIDLGDVTEADLDDAGPGVFAIEGTGTAGPLPTSLGPALFRMNGVLIAQETTYEEARPELLDEFALDRARRVIENTIDDVENLLAGGATLEELANESELVLGEIDFNASSGEGPAAYSAFRDAATLIRESDFAELTELDDGGIIAARMDALIAPVLLEFDEVRDAVIAGWQAEQTDIRLLAQAEALMLQVAHSGTLVGQNLEETVETEATRTSFIDGAPEDMISNIFEMDEGDLRVSSAFGAVYVARLDAIQAADFDNAETAELLEQVNLRLTSSYSQDIFESYARALERGAGLTIDQRALDAVHAQFR